MTRCRLACLITLSLTAACRAEGTTKFETDRDRDGLAGDDDCDDTDANIGGGQEYFVDADGDGHGDATQVDTACEPVADRVTVGDDCNDADATIYPGADDTCDGVDTNCDGVIDDGAESIAYYTDADADGFGDDATLTTACAQPAGTATLGGDCDDADAAYHPSATEADCEDPNDYNCDGSVGYADVDADGFAACKECDDATASTFPDAIETCNSADDDCDGSIDEESADMLVYYADLDGDGYGDPLNTGAACELDVGWVENALDCDDSRSDIRPDASEACNGYDDDCDGLIDDDDDSLDPSTASVWYADADADGYGTSGTEVLACLAPAGTSAFDGDCDDADTAYNPGADESDCTDPADYNCDGSVAYTDADADTFPACEECDDSDADNFPGATEWCDGVDNNCDGNVDEATATDAATWYADTDTDGYGDPATALASCDAPAGYIADATDCNDAADDVNPAQVEICNDIDDDCDGDADTDAADAATWYADSDGDEFGDAGSTAESCDAPSGHVAEAGDCDDLDSATFPDANEVCDGIDNDCDTLADDADPSVDASTATTWFTDADGDGFGDATLPVVACAQPSGTTEAATDCDDADEYVYPEAPQICGLDADCDGTTDDLDPGAVYAGSLSAGESHHYQYSDVTAGAGELRANWSGHADAGGYELAVGTTPGAADIQTWASVSAVTSETASGLSLDGAWTGAEYYVSIVATLGGGACATVATSQAVQVAEAITWTGDIADLRPNDAYGGSTADWPETGVDAVYGEHYFESVAIEDGTTVRVQGWGAVAVVAEGVAATDSAVVGPADGWLAVYANDIAVAGTITASGRGFGGGGGGGGGSATTSYRGRGGNGGLGGDGGVSFSAYAGAGGGGSPGGIGGAGATYGGDGNLFGAGSGSTGCSGANGRDGGDGAVSTVGGTGGTAGTSAPGIAGVGEFAAGGGTGVSGCDNWSGGGGGGYGAGGGGGGQWAGSTQDSSGGGAGGTGGVGGGDTADGGAGAGAFGGTGGVGSCSGRTGCTGVDGGYLSAAANGDSSTDRTLALGGGGGGGGGGYQETGGGGGGAGGGAIHVYAVDTLLIDSTAYLLANGAGGGGGARDTGGAATAAGGGVGAGGGIRLEAETIQVDAVFPAISARGGDGATSNGGTIKVFYDTFGGTVPDTAAAGRLYDAGAGSYEAP